MPAVEELVDENAAISEQVAQEFLDQFGSLEDEMVSRLQALLKKFTIKGGRFVVDATSNQILTQIDRIVRQVIKMEDLRSAVRDLLPEFDRIAENVRLMHGEENDIRVSKALVNEQKQRMIDLTINGVVEGGYNADFIVPVKRILFQHVNFGAEVDQAERAIRALVKNDRALTSNAGTMARDALNQYEGQVHKEIAMRYDLHNYRYLGNILPGHIATKGPRQGREIGGSRPQCRRWHKMEIITQDQLAREVAWMLKNGTGWIPGTTPAIWPIVRGGYGCLHTALPTRREP